MMATKYVKFSFPHTIHGFTAFVVYARRSNMCIVYSTNMLSPSLLLGEKLERIVIIIGLDYELQSI